MPKTPQSARGLILLPVILKAMILAEGQICGEIWQRTIPLVLEMLEVWDVDLEIMWFWVEVMVMIWEMATSIAYQVVEV